MSDQDAKVVGLDRKQHTVVLRLTRSQRALVDGLFERAKLAADGGEPGMIAAQVFPDGMRVGFLPHEVAKYFSLAMVGETQFRKTVKGDAKPWPPK